MALNLTINTTNPPLGELQFAIIAYMIIRFVWQLHKGSTKFSFINLYKWIVTNIWHCHSILKHLSPFSYVSFFRCYPILATVVFNVSKPRTIQYKVETMLAINANILTPYLQALFNVVVWLTFKILCSSRVYLQFVAVSAEAKVSLHVVVALRTTACGPFVLFSPVMTHAFFNVHIYFFRH